MRQHLNQNKTLLMVIILSIILPLPTLCERNKISSSRKLESSYTLDTFIQFFPPSNDPHNTIIYSIDNELYAFGEHRNNPTYIYVYSLDSNGRYKYESSTSNLILCESTEGTTPVKKMVYEGSEVSSLLDFGVYKDKNSAGEEYLFLSYHQSNHIWVVDVKNYSMKYNHISMIDTMDSSNYGFYFPSIIKLGSNSFIHIYPRERSKLTLINLSIDNNFDIVENSAYIEGPSEGNDGTTYYFGAKAVSCFLTDDKLYI